MGLILGIVFGSIGLIALIILIWGISTYNSLIRMKNGIEEAFSTMDVYLKKRYDLIPNLVETAKGYMKHENETLTNVIKARNLAMTATTTEEKLKQENNLTKALRSLYKLNEAYPDLKADKHFSTLMNELKNIESEIAESRKYYNGTVRQFNTKIEVFPSSIIARMKKFEKKPLFEVDSTEERKNVKVQF